jgi:hypothetical protein
MLMLSFAGAVHTVDRFILLPGKIRIVNNLYIYSTYTAVYIFLLDVDFPVFFCRLHCAWWQVFLLLKHKHLLLHARSVIQITSVCSHDRKGCLLFVLDLAQLYHIF